MAGLIQTYSDILSEKQTMRSTEKVSVFALDASSSRGRKCTNIELRGQKSKSTKDRKTRFLETAIVF